jgi:acyl-CoA thioester hydrolase
VTDDFRHRTELEVRFRDIDALRHVNNAVFFSYLEQARARYLIDVLDLDMVSGLPMILASVRLDYRSPIHYGERIGIDTRVDWVGTTSISMSHRLTAGEAGRLAAESVTILVSYDYDTARPQPVPDAWRTRLAAYEGHSLERPAMHQGDS